MYCRGLYYCGNLHIWRIRIIYSYMCINRHVREKEKQEENTKDLQGYLDIDEEIDIFKIKTVSIVRYTNDMPIC